MRLDDLLGWFLKGWPAIRDQPELFVATIALTAVAVWWVRGWFARSQVEGLKAQLDVQSERLKLASEKATAAAEERERLEARLMTMDEEIRRLDGDKIPVYALVNNSLAAISSFHKLDRLGDELEESLGPEQQRQSPSA